MTLAKIIQMPSVLVGAYARASKNENWPEEHVYLKYSNIVAYIRNYQ